MLNNSFLRQIFVLVLCLIIHHTDRWSMMHRNRAIERGGAERERGEREREGRERERVEEEEELSTTATTTSRGEKNLNFFVEKAVDLDRSETEAGDNYVHTD